MVVIAAAVLTKVGKLLLSRQFVDIPRVRIEGLLAAFPKLLAPGQLHTFIETETVRYVYQPLDSLYLLIITNKSSNILEDLETLRLLAKVIPEYCNSQSEDSVLASVFELVFAFDELVAGGYREKVTLSQVHTFLEMDSHEEKLFEKLEQHKIREAREEADRKRMEIEAQRGRSGGYSSQMSAPLSSFGGGGGLGLGSSPSSGYDQPTEPTVLRTETSRGASASSGSVSGGKGMQLRTQDSSSKFMQALGHADVSAGSSGAAGAAAGAAAGRPGAAATAAVAARIIEQVSAVLHNEGGVSRFEVSGALGLTISKPDFIRCSLQLAVRDAQAFSFKVHPYIDRQAFGTDNRIALRDAGKAFQVGADLQVLKWRLSTTSEEHVPFTVSCWPTTDLGGAAVVNLEYELKNPRFAMNNVQILIPVPEGVPSVRDFDGAWTFDARNRRLVWTFDFVDETCMTGGLEFGLNARCDASTFFPIQIAFVSSHSTICNLDVTAAAQSDGSPVPFSVHRELTVETFQIVT